MLNRKSLLAAAAALTLGAAAQAQVLVNDTWLDGTRSDPAAPTYSEKGVDADVDGNLESAWFQGGGGTLLPVGAGGPLRGTGYGTSSASWTSYFTPEASPVALAQGETLRVTWKFTPTNVNASNTSQNFRLALLDAPSAARISTDASPGSAAYTGYGMFMNMGQTFANSSAFRIQERNVASGDVLTTSGNWAALGTTGVTNGNHGYDSGVEYTFVMDLTRTLADEIAITASMAGGTIDGDGLAFTSFTDTTPNGGSFSFDMFSVRPSNTASTAETFDTSLFRVEVIQVPEPTSLALVGLAGLGVLARRRKA